jgi:hypothetical protein
MEHSIDAIESFASELRKYKTSIILGMQGIKDQLPREVASAIFRNFGTFVSFRLGEPDDAQYVNRSMSSEVLQETDYLQIEPYNAYMRMQVGNERTRPFLIRMKAPGPALYADSISELKKRTIADAMKIERQTTLGSFFKEKQIEDEEKATYEPYFAEEGIQDTSHPNCLIDEVAATIEAFEDTPELKSSFQQNHHPKENDRPKKSADHIVELKEKTKQHETGPLDSERSSSEKEDAQKEKKTETKKVISNDDLWV